MVYSVKRSIKRGNRYEILRQNRPPLLISYHLEKKLEEVSNTIQILSFIFKNGLPFDLKNTCYIKINLRRRINIIGFTQHKTVTFIYKHLRIYFKKTKEKVKKVVLIPNCCNREGVFLTTITSHEDCIENA